MRKRGTDIPEPFVLDDVTKAWLQKRYPQVDEELSVERFTAWASNYTYANWMRTYQNWLNRTADEGRLGPLIRKQTSSDTFTVLEQEALRAGFRKRIGTETESQFTAAFEAHKRSNLAKLRGML